MVSVKRKKPSPNLIWKRNQYRHIYPVPKPQADPSNPWIHEGIDREFKSLSLCILEEWAWRKKLTDHSSSPCSSQGQEGWPGHGLCTHWLGELFTFQHFLCVFVPHFTSTEEWAGFASSHDISGDRPSRCFCVSKGSRRARREVGLNNRVIAQTLSSLSLPSVRPHLLGISFTFTHHRGCLGSFSPEHIHILGCQTQAFNTVIGSLHHFQRWRSLSTDIFLFLYHII